MEEPKEIDFSIIGNWFKNYVVTNKNLIGLLVVGGIIVGLVYHYNTKPVYSSKLLARSTAISNLRIEKIFDPIESKIKEKDFGYLATKFNISNEVASAIKSISIEAIEDKESYFDNHNSPRFESNVFVVEIELMDYNMCGQLTEGVKHYLDSNPYLRDEVRKKKKVFEELIQSLKKDIDLLDKSDWSALNEDGGVIVFNRFEDNMGRLAMRKELMSITKHLMDNNPVEIISEFAPSELRVNSLSSSLLLSVIVILFSGITLMELKNLFFNSGK